MQKYIIGVVFVFGLVFGGMESTQAILIPNNNTFTLDFVAVTVRQFSPTWLWLYIGSGMAIRP